MNKRVSQVLLMFLLSLITSHLISQNIYDAAAKKTEPKDNKEQLYQEYAIATSNAFAYKHKDYNPEPFDKLVYIVNSKDKKILKHIEKIFAKKNIIAVNIENINCNNCENGEQLKEYLSKNDYRCLLKITFTDRMQKRGGFMSSVYSSYGNGRMFTHASAKQDVWAVFEWYNSEYEEIPFLQTQSLKSSVKSSYYSLVEGLINLSILRPIKKGLIIEPN